MRFLRAKPGGKQQPTAASTRREAITVNAHVTDHTYSAISATARNGVCLSYGMTKEHTQQSERPHGHRDRGVSNDQLSKKPATKKDAARSHDPEAQRYEAEKTFEPDRDGSGS
ncbi:MAG: hypothetical protein K2Y23_06535 [Cyanobacteria bacterium]|nr:hypothetical protein [Cyanobacteriota bacterium]